MSTISNEIENIQGNSNSENLLHEETDIQDSSVKNKKTLSKRGRKVKSVNFDVKPGSKIIVESSMDIEESSVLKIPMSLENLLENCKIYTDPETPGYFSGEMGVAPEKVLPINHYVYTGKNNILNNTESSKIVEVENAAISLKNEENYQEICRKTGKEILVKVSDMSVLRETVENKIIAEKTNIFCWWCCHQFDDFPVCAPVKYDTLKEIFKVKGCFCSFNCSKAYMMNERNPSTYLTSCYTKRLLGYIPDVSPAPSRYVLKMFGGPLSIEEYRSTFTKMSSVSFNIYPMVYFPTQVEFRNKRQGPVNDFSSMSRKEESKNISAEDNDKINFSSQNSSVKKSRVITKQNIEVSASRVKKSTEKINKQPKKSLLTLMSIKVVE